MATDEEAGFDLKSFDLNPSHSSSLTREHCSSDLGTSQLECNVNDPRQRSAVAATNSAFIKALTLDDFAEVLKNLFCVRSKWLMIGLELGVHITELNNIEQECNDDGKRLRRMLTLALNRQQVVITWKHICDALYIPTISESVHAKKLEEELQRPTNTQQTRKLDTKGSSGARTQSHKPSSTSTFAATSLCTLDHLQITSIDISSAQAPLNQNADTKLITDRGSSTNKLTSPKEAMQLSLPDVITTGQSNSNPQIKKLPNHYCDKPCHLSFKVNIVGDSAVGKSTMLLRFMEPEFKFGDSMIGPTLSQEFVGVCVFQYKDKLVKLDVWDTAGFERNFGTIQNCFFRDVDGTIIMFDVSDKQTLFNALSDKNSRKDTGKCWMKLVDFKAEDNCYPVKILVGGKIDVDPENERQVTQEEAQKIAQQHNLPYLEVSSKENLGIHEVFYKMVELLVNKYKSNSDAQTTMPCQRRRTRRRDSIQLHDDAHAINSPMTSTARDNTQPQNNTQPHVQVDDERRPRARCHC